MADFGNMLTALADLFLPRLCCVCGGELGRNERHICLNCLADMPLTLDWLVRRNPMAEKFNALIAGHEVSDTGYVDAVALFNFVRNGAIGDVGTDGGDGSGGKAGGYRNITYRLKYSRDIREGRFFAAMLGERARAAEWLSDVDTVIPVPLHWTRRLRRGYNQAEVIASELARALGARLRTDILIRRRRTRTQTKLGIGEKARNVSGAFAVSERFRSRFHEPGIRSGAPSSEGMSGKRDSAAVRHILLVDDVFTTGSTLYNCWRPLHDFFGPSVRISIAALGVV